MEALLLVAGLIVAYLLMRRMRGPQWTILHESPANRPEETTRLNMQLRHRGIRCKLRVVGTGIGSQRSTFLGERSLGQSFQLLVHPDDADEAHRLMEHLKRPDASSS